MKNSNDTFAVAMDCPHATSPCVLVRVWISDEHRQFAPADTREILWEDDARGSFFLWIPSLETWTLDTVRMVLHELSAYGPPDPKAQAGVTARYAPPRGRPGPNRRPRFDEHVEFWVSTRGWRVSIGTDRNERQREGAHGQWVYGGFPTGDWSEPMIATLLELAAKSPFPLQQIARVLPGDPVELGLKYAPRLTTQLGIANTVDRDASALGRISQMVQRIREQLDDMLGDEE